MNPLLRPAGAVLAALLSAGIFQVTPSGAQPIFRGVVRDAVTGEGLGLATIQVKGTFRGTIANQEGQFSLKLEQVPAILLVTHIGYKSQEIAVTVVSSNPLDVHLTPAPYVLQETTVTPENPAQRIMRQVIQRKQEWRPLIQSYKAEAYARRVLENDTSIVFITEDEEKQPQKSQGTLPAEASPAKKGGRLAEFKPAFRPELWFNRVEAAHLGLSAQKGLPRSFSLSLAGGYNTGLKRWSFDTSIRCPWGKKGRGWIELAYHQGAQTRWGSDNYRPAYTSVLPLVGLADYFDYYWREGLQVKTGYQLVKFGTQVTLGFAEEQDASLAKNTDYSLLGGDKVQRINPTVQEGRLRTLTLALVCGRGHRPFGLGANRRLAVEIDHSADWLGGDFSFTQYTLTLDWHQKTFFKRRLTPNALDLRLVAGTATGELPLQRFGALDTALGFFTPFGVFRTAHNRPYEGERHLALFWEHNFRTVPFEMLRLRGLARRGFGVVVQGASGRTWIAKERRALLDYEPRYPDSFHHEVGVSLVLYHLVRLDVTKRLGQDTWTIGASIARFDFE